MTKSHRKMLFTAIVGTTLQIIWLFLFPQMSKTDYFSYYTTTLNYGMLLPIMVQVVSVKFNLFTSILSILLAIVFSPLVWFFIGFQFQIPFLYENLYFKYTPFGLTSTFLSCQLIEAFYNQKRTNTVPSPTTLCLHCGIPVSSKQLFCSNCHTMSPKIKDVFIKFPKKHHLKHHLDFAERKNKGYRHCPHCDEITIRTYGIFPSMGIPVRICGNCQNIYLSDLYCEWSMATITDKIIMCIFDGPHLILYVLLLFQMLEQTLPISIGLISLAVIVFLRVVWFFTISIFDIRESEARLKANPEYPKILVDMGYQILDKRYKIY